MIHARSFAPNGHAQRVVVTVNSEKSSTFTLDNTERTLTIPLSGKIEVLNLHLDLPDAISPRASGVSGDDRELAIGISEIDLVN
ncbi:hypothetical protein GCM10027093_70000 [Paraburkholderia jirisanensis]